MSSSNKAVARPAVKALMSLTTIHAGCSQHALPAKILA
jgi:hypothetical protein